MRRLYAELRPNWGIKIGFYLTREGGIDMKKLVLLRHGQSIWNKQARFTGWADVDLTPKGIEEATTAGRTLMKAGSCLPASKNGFKR